MSDERKPFVAGKNPAFRVLRRFALILAGAGALALLINHVGWSEFLAQLRTVDRRLLALAGALYGWNLALRIVRWWLLLRGVPLSASTAIFGIGVGVNELAPAGAGELTRAAVGRGVYGIPPMRVMAPMAVERLFDLALLAGLASIATLTLLGKDSGWGLGIAAVGILSALFLALRPTVLTPLVGRLSPHPDGPSRFPKVRTAAAGLLSRLVRELSELAGRKRLLGATFAISVLVWLVEGLAQWTMIRAVGVHVDLFIVLGVIGVSYLAGTFSFLPGGIGAREGVFAAMAAGAGAPLAAVAASVITYRAVQWFLHVVLAGGSLLLVGAATAARRTAVDSAGASELAAGATD